MDRLLSFHFSTPFPVPLVYLFQSLEPDLGPTSTPSVRICQSVHPCHTSVSLLQTPAEDFIGITLSLSLKMYYITTYSFTQCVCFLYCPIDCKLLENKMQSIKLSFSTSPFPSPTSSPSLSLLSQFVFIELLK